MPIVINSSSNAPAVALLFQQYADTFPNYVSTALSRTASGARKMLIAETPNYIDSPTPFTLKGFYFKMATGKNRSSEVRTINSFVKQHHLRSQIEGGDRAVKGSERRMRARGYLAATEFLSTGPAMHLNQYGNVSGPKMVRLLSQIRSMDTEAGSKQDRAEGSKSTAFFSSINGHKGIWERRGNKNIRLMMQVTGKPSYQPRFPMVELVNQFVNDHIEDEFWKIYNERKEYRASKGL